MTHIRLVSYVICLAMFTGYSQVSHAQGAIPVTADFLNEIIIFPHQSAPATTLSNNSSDISTEIQGVLLEVPYSVSTLVQPGQTIARLDCRDHELALARTHAALQASKVQQQLAEKQLKRARSLKKQNSIAESQLNESETAYEQLSAQLRMQLLDSEIAARTVDKCIIKAPFRGAITAQFAFSGEWLNPGQAILHIVDMDQLEVSTDIPMTHVNSFLKSVATFETSDTQYALYKASVTPVVNQRSRTQEVRLQFPKQKPLPGTPGRVLWRSPLPHIPAHLLVKREDQMGVFFVAGQHAEFYPLQHALEGRPAPIQIDLQHKIIIDGRHQLQDKDSISVTMTEHQAKE